MERDAGVLAGAEPAAPNTAPTRASAPVRKDASLDADVAPFWMRHICATWLMDAGVTIREVTDYIGMTPSTLEKRHGHHRPEH